MKIEPLLSGSYYHIYNRGVNGCSLFNDDNNYLHFLKLFDRYMHPVAETFAWCLMNNHFHLLLYLKTQDEIDVSTLQYSSVDMPRQVNASRQLSHLFNAYTLAFNKRFSRTGSLFESPFRRKRIDSERYFRQLIHYIHNNPVHHQFVDRMVDYRWSSYHSIVSHKPTKLQRSKVIDLFDSVDNFCFYHQTEHSYDEICEMLLD